jgi:glycosyltransferase involved in cell wall biosynthesis
MISVVVPAFNEQKYLGYCLESLLNQEYNDSFEIIVVDNDSSDNTFSIAESYGVKVITESRPGIAWARQKGFETATGEIIASTDADTVLPGNWLSLIEQLFRENTDAVAIAGHYLLSDGPAITQAAIKLSLMVVPQMVKYTPELWNFPGSNFAVKADAYDEIGGFNPHSELYDDIDLCQRLRRNGRIIFCPELIAYSSGRAFVDDPTGIKHLINYFSQVTINKQVLSVVCGARISNISKN